MTYTDRWLKLAALAWLLLPVAGWAASTAGPNVIGQLPGGASRMDPFPNPADPDYQATYDRLRDQFARQPLVTPGAGAAQADWPRGGEKLAGTPPLLAPLKKALDELGQALRLKPAVEEASDPLNLDRPAKPTPRLYTALARVAEQRGDTRAAEMHYRRALQLDDRYLDALVGYARLADRQRRFDEAIELYRKAAEVGPTHAAVHNDLALCLARRRMWQPAVAAFERAVQLDPRNPRYRNNIATVLVAIGRIDEARRHLVVVHGEAAADYNLGYMMQKRGDRRLAIEFFSAALEKDPSLEQARQWLQYLARNPEPSPDAAPHTAHRSQTVSPSMPTSGPRSVSADSVPPAPMPAAGSRLSGQGPGANLGPPSIPIPASRSDSRDPQAGPTAPLPPDIHSLPPTR